MGILSSNFEMVIVDSWDNGICVCCLKGAKLTLYKEVRKRLFNFVFEPLYLFIAFFFFPICCCTNTTFDLISFASDHFPYSSVKL